MDLLIDKRRVADSFSKAAQTYDSVADLQREVGQELLAYLPQQSVSTMMDLGCGTGYFTPKLKHAYPDATLLNLDLALGMLQFSRAQRCEDQTHWICADAEALPIADQQLDLIFSSLAIQWCEDVEGLFSEISRVLKPGGRFVVATLGPDTLKELRQAWSHADSFTHVNQFMPVEQLKAALPEALCCQTLEQQNKVLRYSQLKQLTDELKRLGAHNMNAGQQQGLTGRERVRRFKEGYEQQRLDDGALPATYQVIYAVFEKEV
ncbi:malonyl-ACP O-methyltransferase BioC [Neptuniibacter sp. QD37_11]|uniref:malonyl-ACP O-methyltransferase BioC n=1 Tax=Neptuniibacter sp. QD37_11 TaxID=3398209 RepID=UPI0039F516CB